jgi:hypothetical protein
MARRIIIAKTINRAKNSMKTDPRLSIGRLTIAGVEGSLFAKASVSRRGLFLSKPPLRQAEASLKQIDVQRQVWVS